MEEHITTSRKEEEEIILEQIHDLSYASEEHSDVTVELNMINGG